MKKQKILKRVTTLFACTIMSVGLLSVTASADSSTYVPDDSIAVFATDRHDDTTIITEVLSAVKDDGMYPGFVGLGGDMVGDGPPIAEDYAPEFNTSQVQGEVHAALSSDVEVAILMAGHDQNAIDDAGILVDTACGFEAGDYYVFIIPEAYMDNEEAAQAASKEFITWAESDEISIEKPIVVLSHLPIHHLRGDNVGATYWHEAINQVATSGNDCATRNIVVFHGHNHTVSTEELFYPVGSQMAIEGFGEDGESEDTIHYTYITAGYLVDNGTVTLLDLDDTKISFYKYSTNGGTPLGSTTRLSGESIPHDVGISDTSEINNDNGNAPRIPRIGGVIIVIAIIAVVIGIVIRKKNKK